MVGLSLELPFIALFHTKIKDNSIPMLQAAPFILSRDISFPLYKDLLPNTMKPFLSQLSGLIVEARDYCLRRHS
jgi:hypothetical protein